MIFHSYLISVILLYAAAFVVFRVFVRHDYLRKGRLTLLSGFLESLIFFMLGYFMYIDILSKGLPTNINPFFMVIGWIFITFGLGLMITTIVGLGIRRSLGQEVNVLKQSGLYHFIRNPQIVTCAFVMIGYAILWPSWHALGWVVLYALIAHIMVLTEEEHLRNVHGEEYERYCERVPRYNFVLGIMKYLSKKAQNQ